MISAGPARERIRVAYCIDNMDFGGTELNAVRTAERLDRSRFELSVACLRPSGPLRARYEALGIPVVGFESGRLYGPSGWRAGGRLLRFFRAQRPHVVHCHDAYTSIFAAPLARAASVPGVIASRRTWRSPHLRRLLWLNRWTYRAADVVLANSPAVARLVETEARYPAARIRVIPNFLDEEAFDPPAPGFVDRFRAELGIPSGATVIGIVARLSRVKDHATLLRAMAEIGDLDDLWCAIVGDGPERAALAALAGSLGVEHRVRFAGHRPPTPSPHAAFDVSVLCSTSEAFPNTVIEAMAAGRAVVATAIGGIPDAVVEGETGILVPPCDPSALASALRRLVDDPAMRAAYGAAAREVARARFSAEKALHDIQSLYSTLAGGAP